MAVLLPVERHHIMGGMLVTYQKTLIVDDVKAILLAYQFLRSGKTLELHWFCFCMNKEDLLKERRHVILIFQGKPWKV